MKKICFIILMTFLVSFVVACSQNDNTNYSPSFVSKCYSEYQEDGWLEYFCIQLSKKNNNYSKVDGNYIFDQKAAYIYDAINLKYKNLDNYYIPVYDLDNKEIDRIVPPYVSLSTSSEYRDEIKMINSFFNDKKINKKIFVEDLKNLKMQKTNKMNLVKFFNRAYEKEPIELGKYVNLPFAGIVSSISNQDYTYQVGYYIEYGNIIKINIELILGEEYISSLIFNNDASKEQKELYNKIKIFEEYIISNQSFDIKNHIEYNQSFQPLANTLRKIELLNE